MTEEQDATELGRGGPSHSDRSPVEFFASRGIGADAHDDGAMDTEQVVGALVSLIRQVTIPVVGRPAIIGLAGSVAAGKTYLARALVRALDAQPGRGKSLQLATDGFIFPNADLDARGLSARKGFPETYDWPLLAARLCALRDDTADARWPTYSHDRYDRGDEVPVVVSDVAIVEGINILQPVELLDELLDHRIYLDATEPDLEQWYVERFMASWLAARSDPTSFYHQWAELTPESAREVALLVWSAINLPNLRGHILPTRDHADLVLHQRGDHAIDRVSDRGPGPSLPGGGS